MLTQVGLTWSGSPEPDIFVSRVSGTYDAVSFELNFVSLSRPGAVWRETCI